MPKYNAEENELRYFAVKWYIKNIFTAAFGGDAFKQLEKANCVFEKNEKGDPETIIMAIREMGRQGRSYFPGPKEHKIKESIYALLPVV